MTIIDQRIQQYLSENPDNLSQRKIDQARIANEKYGIGGWAWRRDLGPGINILPNKAIPLKKLINRRN